MEGDRGLYENTSFCGRCTILFDGSTVTKDVFDRSHFSVIRFISNRVAFLMTVVNMFPPCGLINGHEKRLETSAVGSKIFNNHRSVERRSLDGTK